MAEVVNAPKVYDVIVVGAGVEGSATAYFLAKQNYSVLLLEQYALPHSRGSSHGQSRIIRHAYEEAMYTDMMNESYFMWAELEKEVGVQLYQQAGLITFGPPNSADIIGCKENLERIKAIHEWHNSKEKLQKRFPMFQFGESCEGVYEDNAGILRADRCVQALQKMFVHYGGTLHDSEKVVNVTSIDQSSKVVVETFKQTDCGSDAKTKYFGKSSVICVGTWAPKFFQGLGLNLPLQPQRVQVCYWKPQKPDSYNVGKGFPMFLCCFSPGIEIYGMPSLEYPGLVKINLHVGRNISDPDHRDADGPDHQTIKTLSDFIRKWLPGIEDKPSVLETCLYTMTPDHHFVLDTHPSFKNIVIGAGFSGHGFKMAPFIGKLLGSLAVGRPASYDLSPFRISRFKTISQSHKL